MIPRRLSERMKLLTEQDFIDAEMAANAMIMQTETIDRLMAESIALMSIIEARESGRPVLPN